MNEEELKETFGLITQKWDEEALSEMPFLSREELRNWLSERIEKLMRENFHKLLSILYRIDVHENNVKRVFDEYRPDEIPSMLAELIIQRQLQKAQTRIAYRRQQEQKKKEDT